MPRCQLKHSGHPNKVTTETTDRYRIRDILQVAETSDYPMSLRTSPEVATHSDEHNVRAIDVEGLVLEAPQVARPEH